MDKEKISVIFVLSAENNLPFFFGLANALQPVVKKEEILFIDRLGLSISQIIEKQGYKYLFSDIPKNNYIDSRHDMAHQAYLFLEKHPANIYVLPYEHGFFYFLCQLAKEMNRFTVHLQHALWGEGKFYKEFSQIKANIQNRVPESKWSFRRLKNSVALQLKGAKKNNRPKHLVKALDAYSRLNLDEQHFPLSADYFLVPNVYYQKQVNKERPAFPKKQVVVSGLLKETFNKQKYSREELSRRFDLDANKTWVVYLFAYFEVWSDRFLLKKTSVTAMLEVYQAIEAYPEVQFLCVQHPGAKFLNGNIEAYIPKARFFIANDEHFDLYREAAIVIGVKSSALLEAAAMERPVIRQMDVLDGVYDSIQLSYKSVYTSNNVEQMDSILNDILVKKNHPLKDNQIKMREHFFLNTQKEILKLFFKRMLKF